MTLLTVWDGDGKMYYYIFIERIDWNWVSEVGNASDIPWLPRNVKCYLQLNWDKNLFLVLCWTMGCLYHQVFTCLTSFSLSHFPLKCLTFLNIQWHDARQLSPAQCLHVMSVISASIVMYFSGWKILIASQLFITLFISTVDTRHMVHMGHGCFM